MSADPFTAQCPTVTTLSELLDGELSENAAASSRAHIARCATCADRYERLGSALEKLASKRHPGPESIDDVFVGQVMQRIALQERKSPAKRRGRLAAVGVGTMALALGLALNVDDGPLSPGGAPKSTVAVGPAAVSKVAPNIAPASEFRARGSSQASVQTRPLDATAKVTVYAGRRGTRSLTAGDSVDVSEGLRFAVANPGSRKQMMLFAVDSAGDLHWFYPAWTDARTDPASVPVAPGAKGLLAEGVTPDSPPAGRFEVFSVFSDQPLHVRSVEDLLIRSGVDGLEDGLKSRAPSAHIQRRSLHHRPNP